MRALIVTASLFLAIAHSFSSIPSTIEKLEAARQLSRFATVYKLEYILNSELELEGKFTLQDG
jgi:hypothetical protein|tara:strand:+ start:272 stop:460 length:189 start_codon:yes stop_codon:yes gene_type:complete